MQGPVYRDVCEETGFIIRLCLASSEVRACGDGAVFPDAAKKRFVLVSVIGSPFFEFGLVQELVQDLIQEFGCRMCRVPPEARSTLQPRPSNRLQRPLLLHLRVRFGI